MEWAVPCADHHDGRWARLRKDALCCYVDCVAVQAHLMLFVRRVPAPHLGWVERADHGAQLAGSHLLTVHLRTVQRKTSGRSGYTAPAGELHQHHAYPSLTESPALQGRMTGCQSGKCPKSSGRHAHDSARCCSQLMDGWREADWLDNWGASLASLSLHACHLSHHTVGRVHSVECKRWKGIRDVHLPWPLCNSAPAPAYDPQARK